MKKLPDGSILATGKNPQADTYTFDAKTTRSGITGIRIEVIPDPSLPNGGPGRDSEGNFFLSDFEVDVAPAANPTAVEHVVFRAAEGNEFQPGYSAKGLVNKSPGLHGWAIDSTKPEPWIRQAVLTPEKPFGAPGGSQLTIRLKHMMRHSSRNIGRFRLSVTSIADPESIVRLPARLWPVLETASAQRTPEQRDQLAAAYRDIAPLLDPTRKQIADLNKSLDDLGINTAMILRENPGVIQPAAYIRERGSFLSKGAMVYAGVPSALTAFGFAPASRAAAIRDRSPS